MNKNDIELIFGNSQILLNNDSWFLLNNAQTQYLYGTRFSKYTGILYKWWNEEIHEWGSCCSILIFF